MKDRDYLTIEETASVLGEGANLRGEAWCNLGGTTVASTSQGATPCRAICSTLSSSQSKSSP
jgi:hypothetical protein